MKLWLIRHAKSSWGSAGLSDFDRPLNARGRRDGPNMQAWLQQQEHPATWLWCSPARRARSTAEFVRQGFGLDDNQLTLEPALYHAGPEAMLEIIQQTPAEHESVAVVAHNPGTTYLLNQLAGRTVTANVPTFGVARLDAPAGWEGLRFGSCTLDLFEAPKTIS